MTIVAVPPAMRTAGFPDKSVTLLMISAGPAMGGGHGALHEPPLHVHELEPDGSEFIGSGDVATSARRPSSDLYCRGPVLGALLALVNVWLVCPSQEKIAAPVYVAPFTFIDALAGGSTGKGVIVCTVPDTVTTRKTVKLWAMPALAAAIGS